MPVRRLPIVLLLLLAGGCGSDEPRSATATPTATAVAQPADLERMPQVPPPSGAPPSSATSGRDAFLTAVFHDAEAMWRREFAAAGVYLDTTFFAALSLTAGVRLGDFAQAYVVAHEVGHHVQILLGITQQVAAADERDPRGRNARSVRVELQADCFAGIWAHSAYRRGALTAADFEDALAAAAVIGDDFLQHRTTGTITPHDWTHGSSAQRQHWLTTGFVEGRPAACDTFR